MKRTSRVWLPVTFAAIFLGIVGYFRARHAGESGAASGTSSLGVGLPDATTHAIQLSELEQRLDAQARAARDAAPMPQEREYLTVMFGLRDHLSGAPGETAFFVDCLREFVRRGEGADVEQSLRSAALSSLAFLARAHVQVGLPSDQAAELERLAVTIADREGDEVLLLMCAAALHSLGDEGHDLSPNGDRTLRRLMQNEYVAFGMQQQIANLASARAVVGK